MLALFSEIVILIFSSLRANCSGLGRKSLTTLSSPMGSSVYFIFVFIHPPYLSPISSAVYTNDVPAICKPHCHYAIAHTSDAVKPIFVLAVTNIFNYYTVGIKKSMLRHGKRNVMFCLIFSVFLFIPFKTGFSHK